MCAFSDSGGERIPGGRIGGYGVNIPIPKALFKVKEAAAKLNVSEYTITSFLDDGTLDGFNISTVPDPKRKHVRVTAESVERFLNDPKRKV